MALESVLGELALDSTSENINANLVEIILILAAMNSKQGYLDPTTGASRVAVTTLPTLSTVTTVSTITNQTNIGGLSAAYSQYALMSQMVAPIRSQIVVTT